MEKCLVDSQSVAFTISGPVGIFHVGGSSSLRLDGNSNKVPRYRTCHYDDYGGVLVSCTGEWVRFMRFGVLCRV